MNGFECKATKTLLVISPTRISTQRLRIVGLFSRSMNLGPEFLQLCAVYIKFKGGIVEKGGAIMALPIQRRGQYP
jgi:hypothetical protein